MEVTPEFDGPRIVRLTITSDDLSSIDMKQISFRVLRQGAPLPDMDSIADAMAYLKQHRPQKGPGNLDKKFYAAFVEAYRGLAHTKKPIAILSERLDVPHVRVKSWAVQARKHGFMTPSRKGVVSGDLGWRTGLGR